MFETAISVLSAFGLLALAIGAFAIFMALLVATSVVDYEDDV